MAPSFWSYKMKKPKFKHDCKHCVFLGHAKNRDWYSCQANIGRSIIARFSDDGPDYNSTPLFCCAELTPIEKMALSLGLELSKKEKKKLFKILLRQEKNKLGIEYVPGDELIGESDYFEWRKND